MNPLTWVLLAVPVYILVKGRAPAYVALMKGQK